ncbi:cytochrome P450 [Fulvivirga kasyanovii]|uniref:Cytochrome P450 n=1 Tax=Fulvivirga kasyanovii TaxID=396812 RepID=A0ABW9RSC7_9BACT|nr:cytochrome P450 [Fulvivirga kasyanovii]MTI27069.1 cytochrome P450 [Fulvivirga kasyanovii]
MNLWAPLDQENIRNPFPMYATLRREAPVYKSQTGEWIISRYADVKTILKDPRFRSGNKLEWINRGITYFKSKDQDLSAIASAITSFLLLINPPEHTRIRKLITSVWNDREVDQTILENVDSLLNIKSEDNTFDIVEDFARPLPNMTICKIMGISMEHYQHLTTLSNNLVKILNLYNSFKDLVRIDSAARDFISFFRELLDIKKQRPDNDLISKLIVANASEREPLSDDALISVFIFLFIAGQETTIGLVSTSLLTLSKYPSQLNTLAGNPELMPNAIDELLRYDGPVHLLGRIASENIELGGHCIKQNDTVTLCLASANRDSRHFENADILDITRQPNRHLAFGSGIHFCLGDWLAKRQGALAIQRFLEVYPTYSIVDHTLQWNDNLSIRTLKHLSCRV